jgi:hypothetical protein
MKRYPAAAARRRLSEALDAAEAGEPVVIERRGVRFRLARDEEAPAPASGPALVEILDQGVERGAWTWAMTARGLKFVPGRRPGRRSRT